MLMIILGLLVACIFLKYYAIDANRLKKEIFYAYGKSLAPKDDDLNLFAKRSELNANVAEGL